MIIFKHAASMLGLNFLFVGLFIISQVAESKWFGLKKNSSSNSLIPDRLIDKFTNNGSESSSIEQKISESKQKYALCNDYVDFIPDKVRFCRGACGSKCPQMFLSTKERIKTVILNHNIPCKILHSDDFMPICEILDDFVDPNSQAGKKFLNDRIAEQALYTVKEDKRVNDEDVINIKKSHSLINEEKTVVAESVNSNTSVTALNPNGMDSVLDKMTEEERKNYTDFINTMQINNKFGDSDEYAEFLKSTNKNSNSSFFEDHKNIVLSSLVIVCSVTILAGIIAFKRKE